VGEQGGAMMSRPELSLEAFSKVVEAIYDCALNPEHWRETLRLIVELTESEKAAIGITDHEQGRVVRLYHWGYDEQYIRLYVQKFAGTNPFLILLSHCATAV